MRAYCILIHAGHAEILIHLHAVCLDLLCQLSVHGIDLTGYENFRDLYIRYSAQIVQECFIRLLLCRSCLVTQDRFTDLVSEILCSFNLRNIAVLRKIIINFRENLLLDLVDLDMEHNSRTGQISMVV